ncbi:hypothetical protein [Bacillus sp. 3255]|uniref:hypothetical protein n=1 Tax=Bacillus sp. 3255 TaxID=2817904 RepID=UPI002860FE8A|nr:putative HAD superfamily Cof-like phosphohydrolase [Bacillus sp. 3255]
MDKRYEQVKQFHTACGIEMPATPTMLGREVETSILFGNRMDDLCKSMKKFSKTWTYADNSPFPSTFPVLDRASYMLEELTEFMRAKTIEDQVDALADLIYFAIGTYTLMGVEPEPIFDIVHAANMGKVGPEGKVERDEQGKIKKPEGWHENYAPEAKIRAEIARQSNPIKGFQGGD